MGRQGGRREERKGGPCMGVLERICIPQTTSGCVEMSKTPRLSQSSRLSQYSLFHAVKQQFVLSTRDQCARAYTTIGPKYVHLRRGCQYVGNGYCLHLVTLSEIGWIQNV